MLFHLNRRRSALSNRYTASAANVAFSSARTRANAVSQSCPNPTTQPPSAARASHASASRSSPAGTDRTPPPRKAEDARRWAPGRRENKRSGRRSPPSPPSCRDCDPAREHPDAGRDLLTSIDQRHLAGIHQRVVIGVDVAHAHREPSARGRAPIRRATQSTAPAGTPGPRRPASQHGVAPRSGPSAGGC